MPTDFAFARAAPDPVRPGRVVGVDELGSDGCTRLDMSTGPDVRADPERPPPPDTPVDRTRGAPADALAAHATVLCARAINQMRRLVPAAACCSRGSPRGVHTRACLAWLSLRPTRVNCGLRDRFCRELETTSGVICRVYARPHDGHTRVSRELPRLHQVYTYK